MGKSKKRNLSKSNDKLGISIKRSSAIKTILNNINTHKNKEETEKLISLFGITSEELLEAGADYEAISAIKYLFL